MTEKTSGYFGEYKCNRISEQVRKTELLLRWRYGSKKEEEGKWLDSTPDDLKFDTDWLEGQSFLKKTD